MKNGVSIIIPTCNGGTIFSQCLTAIKHQTYSDRFQLIVVDSGSTDGTVELALRAGATVQKIDQKLFHHAKSRNEALSLANHDKILFMVQDAVPVSETWLAALSRALDDYPVAAVYTSQVPHDDATSYARFDIESINTARGRVPVIQELDSVESYAEMPYHRAYRMIGLDNVCAIYRKKYLLREPFPTVDFAEDMAWAQKNLLLGLKVLYNPQIKVKHSHNRSPHYAFRRQIVNSFWCAKIMGRVEEDFSFVKVEDLKTITGEVLSFVSGMRSRIFACEPEYPKDALFLQEILGKYPGVSRLKGFLTGRFFDRQKPMPEGVRKVALNLESQIEALFHLIQKKYHMKNEKEEVLLLDQVTANVVGRAYGEVYASRLLKGTISPFLESLVRPFFYGV